MTDIIVETRDGVCQLIINRPDKKNALTHKMYSAMADALESVAQDTTLKIVLIKSEGDCFCGGNDLNEFVNGGGSGHMADNIRFMQALLHCPLPVVACVQGVAVGIGATMLLHCDLVIAAEASRYKMPFVDLGLVPEFASSLLLPQLAGHRQAARFLMKGDTMTAGEALSFGLVSEIVPLTDLQSALDETVSSLLAKPRQALLQTKALMQTQIEHLELHMNNELDIFIAQLSSKDAQSAIAQLLTPADTNIK